MPALSRRALLRAALVSGVLKASGTVALAVLPSSSPKAGKLTFGAPLTHSDWMLKPGIDWGPAGVRHMLDACKACGWSKIYWRALDGGRSLYRSKILRAGDKWECAGKAGEVLRMQAPYGEGLAGHAGPESCVGTREGAVEALTGVRVGWAIEPRKVIVRDAQALLMAEGNTGPLTTPERIGSRGVGEPIHARTHLTRKPGGPRLGPCPCRHGSAS